MTRTLIVRPEAEADLAASKLWYEEQHDGLGARFLREVDATFRRITSDPLAFGFVVMHVSFKYRANRTPVVARGVIAIGQFACGIVCIGQFSVGVVSISQFTLAGFAVAQFAVAYSLIAQFGLYLGEGHGQLVFNLWKLLGIR